MDSASLPPLPPGRLGLALADLASEAAPAGLSASAAPGRTRPGSTRLRLVAWRRSPPVAPVHAPFPAWLDPRLEAALRARGVTALYSHQAAALAAARAGRHLLVATPTASGKSLCFHLPVLQSLLEDPRATALYLLPTKALCRQQEQALAALWSGLSPGPAGGGSPVRSCDGDTPAGDRRGARRHARALLTNPEMLHHVLLPGHARWERLWRHLRHVVVDEAHCFSGLQGGHLANVLRRLRRVCARYGSRPRLLLGTATAADPAALAARLLDGEEAAVIAESGAAAGERHFLVADAGPGREAHLEGAERAAACFLRHGVRTLVFARTRLDCERLAISLRRHAGAGRVAPYRGGYLPDERRALEAALREGRVLCLVTTPALEVGIDVAGIDACVLAGFPGSVAAAWQQAGRAGRGGTPAAAVLVTGSGPLDRRVARDPDRVFAAGPEEAAFDPDNPRVLRVHLACALAELPWLAGERLGGRDVAALLEDLARRGLAVRDGRAWSWRGPARPHDGVSLRPGGGAALRLVLDAGAGGPPAPLGEAELGPSALSLAPGALHLHGGRAYRVVSADLAAGEVRVAPAGEAAPGTHSRAHVALQVTRLHPRATRVLGTVAATWGDVRVAARAPSYRPAVRPAGAAWAAWAPSPLPGLAFLTEGVWLSPAPGGRPGDEEAPPGGARRHALSGGVPLERWAEALATAARRLTGAAPRDLRAAVQPAAPPERVPVVTLYETCPGGLCEALFSRLDEWLGLTEALLAEGAGHPSAEGWNRPGPSYNCPGRPRGDAGCWS